MTEKDSRLQSEASSDAGVSDGDGELPSGGGPSGLFRTVDSTEAARRQTGGRQAQYSDTEYEDPPR